MAASRNLFVAATITTVFASGVAVADEPSPPLAKADVEPLVTGKLVRYVRKRDGARVGWDFRSGGDVYYTTSATQRNVNIAGTYRVTDDGAVCFKWTADKYLTLPDGCVRFRRAGTTLQVVGWKDPDNVLGDVEPD